MNKFRVETGVSGNFIRESSKSITVSIVNGPYEYIFLFETLAPLYYKCHRMLLKNCKDTFRIKTISLPLGKDINQDTFNKGDLCILEEYNKHAALYFVSENNYLTYSYNFFIFDGGSCAYDDVPCSTSKRVIYMRLKDFYHDECFNFSDEGN